MKRLQSLVLALAQLPPRVRGAIVVLSDLTLCALAGVLAFWLRQGTFYTFEPVLIFTAFASAAWLATALSRDVYRSVVRFSGRQTIRDLAISCAIMVPILALLLFMARVQGIPRTLSALHPLVFFLFLGGSRLALASLLKQSRQVRRRLRPGKNIVIYGAGDAGQELAASMREHPEFRVVGFVDDDAVLRGRRLDGSRIWHSSELEQALAAGSVNEIFLAMPSCSRSRRRQIVEQVREVAPGVGVRSLPSIAELASGQVSVNDLREIQIEELLGRDQVAPDPLLMSRYVKGKSVMVTGAGGSIGSELCRQILGQGPKRLVLVEQSEHALYLIDSELRELRQRLELDVAILPRLVDISDRPDAERVFRDCRPDTVFHAAAYKHVPLVEADPMAGIRNNIIGTLTCSELAEAHGASRFILVSTDKAVRPSSVMGASKRVCELIIQARAAARPATVYSAVRFGNVLGSSGSVVPLFRRQIAQGGPVTVTHFDATRYFMTIAEAAQLVIQAGAMGQGGDIFLLDMGEPVRIRDLARMMIELSGLTAVDEDHPDGDIEIVEIGLRPGEKVHEELLLGECGLPTSHPRIVRACEEAMDWPKLEAELLGLVRAIDDRDSERALALIRSIVREGGAGSEPASAGRRPGKRVPVQRPKTPATAAATPALATKPAYSS